MRRFLVPALLLGLALASASSPPLGAEEPSLDWRTDLDAARAEARTSGMPLLVVFR